MSGIEAFADELLYRMLASCGELGAELGLSEVAGRALPTGQVPDFTDETALARSRMMDQAWADLASLPAPTSEVEATTRSVLDHLLGEGMFGPYAGVAGRPFAAIPYPLNHLSGHHPTTATLLARDLPAGSREEADAFLEALAAWPEAIAGAIEAFGAHEAAGVATPRTSLTLALAELRSFVAAEPADNVVVSGFGAKLHASLGPTAAAWTARADAIVTGEVIPACEREIAALETALATPRADQGFWRHPDGQAHYAWLLRAHTTTDRAPAEVHALGLAETERVKGEIRRQFAALGFDHDDIGALYGAISGPGNAAFGPPPVSRERALAECRRLVAAFQDRAKPWFPDWPAAAVEVELVAPEFEDSQHSCYTPPMAAGARAGRFSFNLKQSQDRPGWELPVLCAHETAPGHHVQLALAQEAPLCAFRRAIVFTAYIEGWAKYAETLLDDLLVDDPYARLGRLRGELYSSVNLALDTGLHALRWTPARAAAFFRDNTGVSAAFAQSIVDRCLVSPGQLCGYKIGMLAFLDLRQRFAADLAGRRAFHAAVLGQGAVPLSLLNQIARPSL